MLCTNCQIKITPVVAIDIDGTLGDYHGHFLKFLEAYLGNNGHWHMAAVYRGQTGFKRWVMGVYGIDERTWNDIKLAYRQGAQKRSMPVIDGASDFMRWLYTTGTEVWITTTRPFLRLDGIDPDTRAWLARYRINYDGLLYDEDKYARLAERIDPARVVAVLDDLPEQCRAARELFGDSAAIMKEGEYNCESEWDGTRANNWDLAGAAISVRLKEWHERSEPHSGIASLSGHLHSKIGAEGRTMAAVPTHGQDPSHEEQAGASGPLRSGDGRE